jgi:hypothetical protein
MESGITSMSGVAGIVRGLKIANKETHDYHAEDVNTNYRETS